MDYEFIKSRLSPCGLHCGKCFAFSNVSIGKSKLLKVNLGNFGVYAERFVTMLPSSPEYLPGALFSTSSAV